MCFVMAPMCDHSLAQWIACGTNVHLIGMIRSDFVNLTHLFQLRWLILIVFLRYSDCNYWEQKFGFQQILLKQTITLAQNKADLPSSGMISQAGTFSAFRNWPDSQDYEPSDQVWTLLFYWSILPFPGPWWFKYGWDSWRSCMTVLSLTPCWPL